LFFQDWPSASSASSAVGPRPVRRAIFLLYLLFVCSGLSGLIYQVVWVRVFGNVFGNTLHSAALVVAVFMLGLGGGSYVAGAWADGLLLRRRSPLRAYGYFELTIGAMGLGISLLLPHLDRIAAEVSSYSQDSSGWFVLSLPSYATRAAIAIILLMPIALLMGGTLTLLIRFLVQNDLEIGSRRIAVLYAVNTAGAALGCFLTDFLLVPVYGVRATQMAAVALNAVAGAGAIALAPFGIGNSEFGMRLTNAHSKFRAFRFWRGFRDPAGPAQRTRRTPRNNTQGFTFVSSVSFVSAGQLPTDIPEGPKFHIPNSRLHVTPIAVALALTGFAAMGMEILWLRHFTILLGQLRSVFSLLLTVILTGIGAGSLLSAASNRRPRTQGGPAERLIVVQGLFVAATVIGLAAADATAIEAIVAADPAFLAAAGRAIEAASTAEPPSLRFLRELWFNARPILIEAGIPALLMGFAFPLGNAIVQRADEAVGRRAGALYLANTCGAVCGSLVTGFLLLPTLGIQTSASILMMAASAAIFPLFVAESRFPPATGPAQAGHYRVRTCRHAAAGVSLLAAGVALVLWLRLPADYINMRALRPLVTERVLAVSEGLNEIIAVTEIPGQGRRLLTNGHPMSATTPLSQRYMRALAHIPLLSIDRPETVLVIGFGVGNTTHAATLHPSVRRVEVADLSRDVLAHAGYFENVNGGVLSEPRVAVYVNDGRHHLRMKPPASYDLITLEPPPIGYAGMAALYSREFYALARTRLSARGFMSQWLPAYQVPAATSLAMIRAFVDVFPNAVLLSGAEADLLLVGSNQPRVEIDPDRLATALARAPAVHHDLERIDLGTVREIAGTFVGSPGRLTSATEGVDPVTDDRPIQEYGVRSLLTLGEAVPASVVDLSEVGAWCPRCFAGGKPVPLADGLHLYLALLQRAYAASPAEMARVRLLADFAPRTIAGSRYLGAILPDSADLHNALGIALAEKGDVGGAIAEFREAARLAPASASTEWHLGAALAIEGAHDEAIAHLRRSVALDPSNAEARHDLEVVLASMRGRVR
jgi:spermidine synthase